MHACRNVVALPFAAVVEAGMPGYESDVWFGLMVAAGTPIAKASGAKVD